MNTLRTVALLVLTTCCLPAVAADAARVLGRPGPGEVETHGRGLPAAGRRFPSLHESDDRSHPGGVPQELDAGREQCTPGTLEQGHGGGRREDRRHGALRLRRRIQRGIPRGRLRSRDEPPDRACCVSPRPLSTCTSTRRTRCPLERRAPTRWRPARPRWCSRRATPPPARCSVARSIAGRPGSPRACRSTSSVTNLSDFKALFRKWADICVKGLNELKAQSPVPQDLKPKQKL